MTSATDIDAKNLRGRLAVRYQAPEWSLFHEVSDGTGSNKSRAIDALAVNMWPSKGRTVDGVFVPFTAAFEIKVTRADFVRELTDPSKRRPFESQVTEFWFVTPKGLAQKGEVPEGCGLLEAHGKGLRAVVRARQDFARSPGSVLNLAILRRANEAVEEARRPEREFAHLNGRPVTLDELRTVAEKLAKYVHAEEVLSRDRSERLRQRKSRKEARFDEHFSTLRRIISAVRDDLGRRWGDPDPSPDEVARWVGSLTSRRPAKLIQELRRAADNIEAELCLDDSGPTMRSNP